jgi:hypothetical protein
MTAQARPASDPQKRTPSFVCEVPLCVSRAQERTLLARLEAARQIYNACLVSGPQTGAAGARVQGFSACQDAAPR